MTDLPPPPRYPPPPSPPPPPGSGPWRPSPGPAHGPAPADLAGFGQRFAVYLIDGLVLSLTMLATTLVGILAYLGFLWMLWDDRSQTWHDKIMNTVVVRA